MTLASRIKQLRLGSGQSLQEVADLIGASKAHIWDLESGNSKNPSMDLLSKLAVHFKTSVSHLVGEDPESAESPELVAMFRDLKSLDQDKLDMFKAMFEALKNSEKK